MLNKLKTIFLFFNLICLLPLTGEENDEFFFELSQNNYTEDQSELIIDHIQKDKEYKYLEILGAGSYGVVMKIEDKDGNQSALKFQFDDEKFSDCNDVYKAYRKIASIRHAEQILAKTEMPVIFKKTNEESNEVFHYCTIKMELGTESLNPMFNNDESENLERNTELFYDFVTEIVDSFRILHFNCHFYHGDVKPINLIFVVDKETNQIHPKIIDLDFVFESPQKVCEKHNVDYYALTYMLKQNPNKQIKLDESFRKNCNPPFTFYNLRYRAPELKKIVPTLGFDKNPEIKLKQKKEQSLYIWNEDFKEEAYAVGITIKEILEVNKEYLSTQSLKIKDINSMIVNLTKKNVDQRWDVDRAYKFLKRNRYRKMRILI